jgi:hypothetical protein
MRKRHVVWVLAVCLATAAIHRGLGAQEAANGDGGPAPDVVCASKGGERQTCAADTKAGVTLLRSVGPSACVLGASWGYDQQSIWVSDGCSGEFTVASARRRTFGTYTPLQGFKVVDTDKGDVNFKPYTYVRYLNQMGLDETYTNDFGTTSTIDRRQDVQINKVNLQFYGWLLNPKFRYLFFLWTSNGSQGLGAQLALAGFVGYTFNEHFTVNGGIGPLPGVRSTEGNFPLWLTVDNRLLADEFNRPASTSGVWVKGKIADGLDYNVMLGNNLSQLGVDAGQLDNEINTLSGSVVWMPTTGEFGVRDAFGDFDQHERLATRVGAHFTRSDENSQGAPNTDAFENVQIRLSDGSIIFAPDLFGPGIRVTDARYQMASLDAGAKYRGLSLEGEYFRRRVDDFRGPGTAGLDDVNDHSFQLQAGAMVVPKLIQLYVAGSKVYGEHGDPSDARLGVNWYPLRNQVVRWNTEYMHLNRSPIGGLSYPYQVGGDGAVVYTSLELRF